MSYTLRKCPKCGALTHIHKKPGHYVLKNVCDCIKEATDHGLLSDVLTPTGSGYQVWSERNLDLIFHILEGQ